MTSSLDSVRRCPNSNSVWQRLVAQIVPNSVSSDWLKRHSFLRILLNMIRRLRIPKTAIDALHTKRTMTEKDKNSGYKEPLIWS